MEVEDRVRSWLALLVFLACAALLAPSLAESNRWRDSRDPGPLAPPPKQRISKKEAPQSVDPLSDFRGQFCEGRAEAIRKLQSAYGDQTRILLHTRQENHDEIIFSTTNQKQPIQSAIYTQLMTISHLPVTALSILLSDLLQNNFKLPADFQESTAYMMLKEFRQSLLRFDTDKLASNHSTVALEIINQVSTFVNRTLSAPDSVNLDLVEHFTRELEPHLKVAAVLAVKDYYNILNGINSVVRNDPSQWNVVIAVEGFSYPGSFLVQYYEQLLRTVVGENSYSLERIALLPQATCNQSNPVNDTTTSTMALANTTSTMALANTTYIHTLNRLFGKCRFSPVHSILSDAAREVLGSQESSTPADCAPVVTFKGFETVLEKLYIVLIVTLLSTTIVFAVVVLSMCNEDRNMKKEEEALKMKVNKSTDRIAGPSLLTPIAEKDFASSYSAFHQRRKKHIQSVHKLRTETAPAEKASSGVKYVRLSSDPDSPLLSNGVGSSGAGGTVTCTEISLADLTEP